jgi:mono/diheme cytochrome c family protein
MEMGKMMPQDGRDDPMRAMILTGALTLGGCMMTEMPGPSEGAQLFAENCAACHGADARGGGPETFGLGKEPPDLTRIAARNGGEFPRARILSVIDGYRQGAHTGRIMPEFGAELGGDLVPVDIDGTMTPTPRALAALLAYLESIQE